MSYLPAESDSGMFGGNSNWRGPIWVPVNTLIIRALMHYFAYYGDNFKIECPTGSGKLMNLFEVAQEITNRLARIFLRDEAGRRPVFGGAEKFQRDPHWRDHLLFYEYFHGDNGAGIGASHQTGMDRGRRRPGRIFWPHRRPNRPGSGHRPRLDPKDEHAYGEDAIPVPARGAQSDRFSSRGFTCAVTVTAGPSRSEISRRIVSFC